MAELTTWQGGVLVDDEVAAPRPRSFIGGLLLLVLVADLLLEAILARVPTSDPPIVDAASARAALAAAADDPGEPWLLIGDSVLAGDVMQGKVDDWEHQRVIDAMRAAKNPASPATFHQVALDAMLPVDIRQLLAELDAVDPGARVPVVIELNARYFSPSYAELADCTRPWLCELGPRLTDGKHRTRWHALAPWLGRLARDELAAMLPIVRHGPRIRHDPLVSSMAELIAPADASEVDELSSRARVLAHYRSPRLGTDSLQMQAMAAIVDRLRVSGRKAVFFVTPLEDEFTDAAMSPTAYGHYMSRLGSTIEAKGGPNVSLVQLDHPLFDASLFLDHCHLGPEGNRRLAVNLLAELGIGLAHVPTDGELAHRDAPDRTLVARIDQGFADGPAWHAQLLDPIGIAVARDGRRVVIADTGNHVIRQLGGRLQTLRTIAGRAGKAGHHDGPAARASFDSPSHPVLVGRSIFVADQKGTSLRVIERGRVDTVEVEHGPTWTRIDGLVAHHDDVLVLDEGRRVLRLDPASRSVAEIATATGDVVLEAIAVAPDGRLFVVDGTSRIWLGHVDHGRTIGDAPEHAELHFANVGTSSMPQAKNIYFPLRYDELRLEHVVGIQWVERYQALLVQDDHAPKKKGRALTERIHLRLLHPASEMIYPWVKPMVPGAGHMTYNRKTDSYVSPIHVGSMAIAQDTATMFYVEKDRSRVYALSDGILGAAKLGFIALNAQGVKYLLGVPASTATLANLHPDHHLGARLELVPRKGPYLAAVFGSSMLSRTDMLGTWSFAARLEQELRDALGYRDGIRIDVIGRAYAGVRSEKLLQELRTFVETGAQPDVIFIEMAGTRTRERFFEKDASEERMRQVLAEVDAIARIHDSLVVFFDDSALVSDGREGLRRVSEDERTFHAMARAAGFTVISVADELLDDSLETGPMGSPPYGQHHASPWGIDAAVRLLAARSHAPLRAWLDGRVPSWMRPPYDGTADPDALADAFAEVGDDWTKLVTPPGADAMQYELTGDTLEIFVDLGRMDVGDDEAEHEAVAVGALWAALVADPVGARARKATLRLARFSRYDEYGAGVRDAADIVLQWELDRAELVARLTAFRQRR
jgi:hypothetical protein